MDVLVSGGSGFLGQKVVSRLLDEGHSVTVISRRSGKSAFPDYGGRFQTVTWDGLSGAAVASRCDAVIHLAGEPVFPGFWTEAKKERLLSSRVATLERMLTVLRQGGASPRCLVSASAIGIYGNSGDVEVDESSVLGSDFLADLVVRWERSALEESKGIFSNIRAISLRFGVVFASDGGVLKRLIPLFKMGLGGRLGAGTQAMSWVHADDAVESIMLALNNPNVNGAYNVVAPEVVTNSEFTRVLANALSRPAFFFVPAWIIRVVFGEGSCVVLDGQRVSGKKLVEAGFAYRFKTLESALRNIIVRTA